MDIRTDIKMRADIPDAEKQRMETLIRNIEFLCRTPRGSLPLSRGFGIDSDAIDSGFAAAKRKITVSAVEGIRKYFGVTVSEIDVTADKDGIMLIRITI